VVQAKRKAKTKTKEAIKTQAKEKAKGEAEVTKRAILLNVKAKAGLSFWASIGSLETRVLVALRMLSLERKSIAFC
jgi:hypothetical protein